MAKQGPKVRNACEECHTRKTKCVIRPEGGACNACQANSRECYFKPRFKSGRPFSDPSDERNNPVPPEQAQVFEFTAVPSSPASSDAQDYREFFRSQASANSSSTASMANVDMTSDQDRPRPMHAHSDSTAMSMNGMGQFQAGYPEMPPSSLGMMEDSSLTATSSLPFCNPMDMSFPGFGQDQGYQGNMMSPPPSRTGSYNPIGSMTYSTSPNSYGSGPGSRSSSVSGKGTTFILEQCLEVQRELDDIQEMLNNTAGSAVPEDVFRSVITTLALNCEMIPSLLPKSSSGSSKQGLPTLDAALLAMFAIRKGLDIFSVLFQSRIQKPRSLDDILLFKRLEVNIMELHLGLSQIKQHCQSLQAVADEGLKRSTAILHNLQKLAA